jgi:hypothetical protein
MSEISKEAMAEALSQQRANAFSGTGEELSEDEIIQLFIKRTDDPVAKNG